MRVLIATSNPGKLRDFAGAARPFGVAVEGLPGIASIPAPVEDQPSFEANARKKAEHYSRFAPGELVLADDSGLEVAALGGAPGIYSARYAAMDQRGAETGSNSPDAENNARLLRELRDIADERRTARFVCVIAVARDGENVATFDGAAHGVILHQPRGSGGFGYDPLFYFPAIDRTFAELPPEQKAKYSHRGDAFRKFLEWMQSRPENAKR
jgi:XTP/dITP diphosphohydrolase